MKIKEIKSNEVDKEWKELYLDAKKRGLRTYGGVGEGENEERLKEVSSIAKNDGYEVIEGFRLEGKDSKTDCFITAHLFNANKFN